MEAARNTRWSLAAAVAVNMIVLGPAYFWYDYRLAIGSHLSSARIALSVWTHVVQVGFSLVFALLTLVRRYYRFGKTWEEGLIKASLVLLVVTTTIHAVSGEIGSVRFSVYALVIIATVGVYYEPVWLMGILYIGSASFIVVYTEIFYPDSYGTLSGQLTVMVTAVGSLIVYTAWDRARYRIHQRELQLAKMNSLKDALIRATGHDLRAPYEMIRRLLPFLEESDDVFLRQRTAIRTQLERLFQRSALVIDNIVALNGEEEEAWSSYTEDVISLPELIADVLRATQPDAEAKRVRLDTEIPEDLLACGDGRMLRTVLLNLIGNALKYSYPETRVRLQAVVGTRTITVKVIDGGIGFPTDVLRAIERGERVESRTGTAGESGSGIGLSVCRIFLANHGAQLSFHNLPEGGAEVAFDLKRYRKEYAVDTCSAGR